MKLQLKTLTGAMFSVEVDPSCTIAQLKLLIQEAKPEFLVETQKLILSGKVLDKADQTLAEFNLQEKDFLVVMIQKVVHY